MPNEPYPDFDDPGQQQEFIKLRDAYAALEKDFKAERRARETLEKKLADDAAERRTSAAEAVFTKLNLNPRDSEFFLLKNPEAEITEEAVAAFATDRGWLSLSPPEVPAPEPVNTPAPPSFVPVTGVLPPAQTLDLKGLKELYSKDPNRAIGLVERGEVQGLATATRGGQNDSAEASF